MRQHHPLGPAGGARGVHDDRNIVLGGGFTFRQRGRIADKIADRLPTRRRAIGRQIQPAAQPLANAINDWPVRAIGHEGVNPRIVDDVIKLRPGQAVVQRHENRAQLRRRKQQVEIDRLV